ncbi:MAG: GTPase HflX [Hyphomicrobiales bacterium]
MLTPQSRTQARRESARSDEARLAEAVGLAAAIGLDVRASALIPLQKPRPATLLGKGKVEEIKVLARTEDATLVIVDHPLTPVQQRNLEREWKAKVLDRTGLILEIFGQRASTREGRLQVELAHLTYQKSRLVRSWTHLERQRGGFGFLGGPGETQIESDRRVIQERIDAIRRELETVTRTRELHRRSRRRVPYPIIALVGYTNAGKSTLFNRLTGAGVRAEDLLFATLDPTMREITLPEGGKAILSDTVGFISDLPTSLIAAFRATLEEVVEADLIVHVRDIAHADSQAQLENVDSVLNELGLGDARKEGRLLEVWNKVDLLDLPGRDRVLNSVDRAGAVCVSAATGEGIPQLLATIAAKLNTTHAIMELTLKPADGALANWLHEHAEILSRQARDTGETAYIFRISPLNRERLNTLLRKRGHEAAA